MCVWPCRSVGGYGSPAQKAVSYLASLSPFSSSSPATLADVDEEEEGAEEERVKGEAEAAAAVAEARWASLGGMHHASFPARTPSTLNHAAIKSPSITRGADLAPSAHLNLNLCQ